MARTRKFHSKNPLKEEIKSALKPEEQKEVDNVDEVQTKETKVEVVSDTKPDPLKIKGMDSAYEYRFLNVQPDLLDRKTRIGWEIIHGAEAEQMAKINRISLRQGQIRFGDLVLAKMPKEQAEQIKRRTRDLTERQTSDNTTRLRRDMGRKYSRNVEESLKVKR